MTSKKKLRSLLGGTLFMVLMLSVHPTTVSASAVGSSTVMDQSVETEDQQSGIQSETQTQASQDSGAAVRASQNGWVKAGDSGWYFYENGQLKTGWLYRNGNWYWLDPDRNGRMAENSWFTYDNNLYYAKGDGAIYKNGFQEVDGNLYYFQSWGGIQRNVYLSISGKMYYVQENGIVARGIVRTMNGHGDLCAFDDTTGAQITQKGWLKKGTSYYWVREDGVLQTGWLLYDDNWYWFDDNGVMMTSGWKEINNNLYYFRSWGGIYKNGFQSIGGNEYYFQSWGGVYRNTFFTVKGKTYIAQNDGSIYHASQTGWVQLGDQTYWINQDGSVQTGWLKLEGKWYWLKADGTRAASEWITYDNNRYYFDGDGVMYTGMKEVDGARYYFHSWGGVYHNESFTWQGKKYWAKDDGTFYTGVCDINGKKYYFLEDGEQITKEGWYLTNGTYYWINANGTRRDDELFQYDGNYYYVDKNGVMATSGWVYWDYNYYYPRSWGGMYKNAFITYDNNLYYLGSDSKMAIGWQSIGGNTYYFRSWGGMITGKQVIDGKTYVFDEDGKLVQSPDGFEPSAQIGVRTVRNFLKNALLPLGNTLYIWGGGHTDAEAESYGVNAQWKQFFNTQNSTYNYSDHLYEYGKGLDCSGYVGWTAHQVTKEYATTTSTGMPAYFARKGWGTCVTGDTSQKFTPGDVVSKSGHVWIVIGQCSDGSVVVIHATPPYIQLGGTVSSTGSINSEAIELANEYMKMYYPVAYERYGVKVLDRSYLTGVNHFTWSSSILSDSEGYRRKKPAEILNDLFQ
jgi:glucan-binding YG repeat protein